MVDVGYDRQGLLSPGATEDSDEVLLDTEEILARARVVRDTSLDFNLEGDISVPGAPAPHDDQEFNTLDEPVRQTVMRDVKAVGNKLFHVLYPKESKSLLREWDLWGPLFLCVCTAMMLQDSATTVDRMDSGGPQFAEVFVIYWVGASIVTLNIKLLGGSISFFQSICVLGYCVLPLTVTLIVCRLILLAHSQSTILFIIRCTKWPRIFCMY